MSDRNTAFTVGTNRADVLKRLVDWAGDRRYAPELNTIIADARKELAAKPWWQRLPGF